MRAIQLVLFLSFLSFLNPCLVISNFQNDKCTPQDNTTYMFAYSNDIAPESIFEVLNYMKKGYPVARQFVKFARVLFDVQQPEEIKYHDSLNELILDANNSLPDPRLSYSSISEGSDVISVLEKFLKNTKFPICGSRINFLVKRLPTEVDVKSIVAKLKKFHVEVYFGISENFIGGNTFDALNEIAFRTNGMLMFLKDESLFMGVFSTQHYTKETLIYATNFNVSGQGTVELPPMTIPFRAGQWFIMSFKDDPVSDAFQSATITCTNTITDKSFIYEYTITNTGLVNFIRRTTLWDEGIYTMKLEYKYANQDVERLFIRIRTTDT
ncbi:hypothetical protein B9Z55_011007 [Caenorhabditis nigoni]|uniref:DUF7154 domain-containing protein n=1 Tax=Caenorhabditis nigoni TaxID=1611254 RepID=A0A2G5UI88_9PELO|nr:hypothetical protein B9Z55_011007 [Caenorhabditis nigoni]